ncbi:MAG: Spy/CpxP family protein refolding chaperone [Pseudomonadales bacterium]|nr:Spy/CpxP family protein refolding chaperone [Halioglobus sp.]MCP5129713.1 Spy/CpxP family protein refolding chaperone [Pseudomonadales bacterium]
MKTTLKSWLLGGALVGAAALSSVGWAQGHHPGMSPDPERMLSHMSKELDLSAEQQAQVETLLGSVKEATGADRKRMGELRGELMAMRSDFDSGKARQIADEIGQLTGDMVYRASETWSQVYQVLNAEQRAELESMMEKRGERRKGGLRRDSKPAE